MLVSSSLIPTCLHESRFVDIQINHKRFDLVSTLTQYVSISNEKGQNLADKLVI